MWKNIVERGKPQMKIWRMRIARCIPKATNAHTGCVTLKALPLQKWLHERASILRYTYIACLVYFLVWFFSAGKASGAWCSPAPLCLHGMDRNNFTFAFTLKHFFHYLLRSFTLVEVWRSTALLVLWIYIPDKTWRHYHSIRALEQNVALLILKY